MKRKNFAPILFGIFCLTIIVWIIYATIHEDCVSIYRVSSMNDTTSIKYIVAESDIWLNGKHYVQVIDTVGKEVNVASYIYHIIFFIAAIAIFILILIMLDITKDDKE